MRCRLRIGKAMQIGRQHGRTDVVGGMVRGGTEHRVDLWLFDGRLLSVYRDGSTAFSGPYDRTLRARWPHLKKRDRIYFV